MSKKKKDAEKRYVEVNNMSESERLNMLFKSMQNGLRTAKSVQAREFVDSLSLDIYKLEIGYNSAQFFHREEERFKKLFVRSGILTVRARNGKAKGMAYSMFGAKSLIFPLKNRCNEIVNYCAISLGKAETAYFLNYDGFFPCLPPEKTERLFITDTILDAATIMQSGVLRKNEAVLAKFDKGLMPHQTEAIEELKNLSEIIEIKQGKHE